MVQTKSTDKTVSPLSSFFIPKLVASGQHYAQPIPALCDTALIPFFDRLIVCYRKLYYSKQYHHQSDTDKNNTCVFECCIILFYDTRNKKVKSSACSAYYKHRLIQRQYDINSILSHY